MYNEKSINKGSTMVPGGGGGGGGTLIFCGYIGEAQASTPKPKILLTFTDHPKKIPVLSGIAKKYLDFYLTPKNYSSFLCLLMKFYHI